MRSMVIYLLALWNCHTHFGNELVGAQNQLWSGYGRYFDRFSQGHGCTFSDETFFRCYMRDSVN